MNRSHRAFVARVHGLKHVEGFFSTHLPDDDAVGAHAKAVYKQLTLTDGSEPFDVRRPGLQTNDIFLRELQFGCIFDRDKTFVFWDVSRQDVQQGGLARASTT